MSTIKEVKKYLKKNIVFILTIIIMMVYLIQCDAYPSANDYKYTITAAPRDSGLYFIQYFIKEDSTIIYGPVEKHH